MSTYSQILYHLVYSTKSREKTLIEAGQDKLYKNVIRDYSQKEVI